MSGDLVDTTEMYLKAIYELEEEGVPPLRARLVERLGQSKPTVYAEGLQDHRSRRWGTAAASG